MRIMAHQERTQQSGIVGPDGAANAWSVGKLRPPLAHLRRIAEDTRIGQLVEHVEIAEDRSEDRIDQAEIYAGEERPLAERRLDTRQLRGNRLPLALEDRGVGGGLEAP